MPKPGPQPSRGTAKSSRRPPSVSASFQTCSCRMLLHRFTSIPLCCLVGANKRASVLS